METLLPLYAQPYDPRFPVVCFDERPCFLLGDVVEGLAPQPAQPGKKGQPAKQHYAYSKHGSCCVLAAVEPLTGQRLYQVRRQRTKRDYTQFMQQLAARYPQAEKIRLVQDNLNTHALSTFYDCLPAAMAEKLAARFQVYYTPKCGSWLNQIELDFSALSRQCLNRRIPTQAQLAYQVSCWSRQRQQQGVKIRWQFTVTQARQTLNSQVVVYLRMMLRLWLSMTILIRAVCICRHLLNEQLLRTSTPHRWRNEQLMASTILVWPSPFGQGRCR